MFGPMTGRTLGPGQEGSRTGRKSGVWGLGHAELEAFMKCTGEGSSKPWETGAGVQEVDQDQSYKVGVISSEC